MRYASVCSGVEAASLAWMPLGWEAVWFSEIEPFPCAVLQKHYPTVPNLGDMTKITKINEKDITNGTTTIMDGARFDLLVGGTPCQDLSVAGKRAGLAGERSGLAWVYTRLLEECQPQYFVWENVPGALSSNGVDDFKALVKSFTDCGYGVSWRVLDAQWVRVDGYPFAIPQRRRRLFVVGCLGDATGAGQILLEPEGVFRSDPPRRKTWQEIARLVGEDSKGAGGGFAQSIGGGQVSPTIINGLSHSTGYGEISNTYIYDGVASTLATIDRKFPQCVCHDEQASIGGGDVSPTIIRAIHKGTGFKEISDTFVYRKWWYGSDTSGTLTCTSNNQREPDLGRFQCLTQTGVDAYNQSLTGDVACSITESGQQVAGHSGAKLIQTGADVYNMEFTGEVGAPLTTATGSCNGTGPKVICFEPGISTRDCNDNRFNDELCTTLRAKAGDNQQAICFRPGITTRLGRPMERTGVSGTLGHTTGDNTEHVMIYNSADAMRMRSGKEGGGKGALVSKDTSLTLATGNDQSVFCYDDQGGGVMYERNDGASPTIRSEMRHHEPMVYGYDVTGCSISEGVMGTIAKNCGQSANRCGGGSVLESKVYAIDGDKINKAERKGGSGMGVSEDDVSYTETAKDVHAVAYVKTGRPKEAGGCPTFKDTGVANTLNSFDGAGEVRANELVCSKVYTMDSVSSNSMQSSNPNSGIHEANVANTLDTTTPTPQKNQGGQMVTVFDNHSNDSRVTEAKGGAVQSLTTRAGTGGGNLPFVAKTGVVRRLTPRECERLMGFPDDYTKIAWRGKSAEDCPDSPRYAACGNSMCVNVMRWIGMRIENYDKKHKETENEN